MARAGTTVPQRVGPRRMTRRRAVHCSCLARGRYPHARRWPGRRSVALHVCAGQRAPGRRRGCRCCPWWGPAGSGGGHEAPRTVLQLCHRRTPSALDPVAPHEGAGDLTPKLRSEYLRTVAPETFRRKAKLMVRVRTLRTQQRVKNRCQLPRPGVMVWLPRSGWVHCCSGRISFGWTMND